MHIVIPAQHIANRRPGRLLCLPMLLLLILLHTPGAALFLVIGCAHLLSDGIADWRQARRHSRNLSRNLPGGPVL